MKKLLTGFISADLMRRQEELRRMEELHNQEMQKRKEIQLRLVWLSWDFIQSYIYTFFFPNYLHMKVFIFQETPLLLHFVFAKLNCCVSFSSSL